MTEAFQSELFRNEGPDLRSVRLEIRGDGSLRLDCQDIGENVERLMGDADYEFWVDVPAGEIRKLVFALMRDKYRDREHAVDEFRDFCEREGVKHQWSSWT